MFKFEKLVFGDLGWGDEFLWATVMTINICRTLARFGLRRKHVKQADQICEAATTTQSIRRLRYVDEDL